jgi:hypothetical protein
MGQSRRPENPARPSPGSSKVLDIEHEQMIRALAPDRADQALNIPILPGRAYDVGRVPDPHCSHTSLECNTAVACSHSRPLQICVLSGTELAFAEEVKCAPFSLINWTVKTIEARTAIFRQVNKDIPRVHHDALEFANGTHVLLTDLLDGQEATVLQLPAQPKTPAEEAAQRRVACVG